MSEDNNQKENGTSNGSGGGGGDVPEIELIIKVSYNISQFDSFVRSTFFSIGSFH